MPDQSNYGKKNTGLVTTTSNNSGTENNEPPKPTLTEDEWSEVREKDKDMYIADNRSYSFGGLSTNKYESYSTVYSGTHHTSLDPNAFNRYKQIFPDDEISSFKQFVFFVRPDLNMNALVEAESIFQNDYFKKLLISDPFVIRQLTHSTNGVFGNTLRCPSNHFISFLSSRVMSYDLPDVDLATFSSDQPYTGYKIMYGGTTNASKSGQNATIGFRDGANLEVTKLFDAWIRYISMVVGGDCDPYYDYIQSRIGNGINTMDYSTSIYMIMTKADATTIVYWHKLTGVFPTNIPHSVWSYNTNGNLDGDSSNITVSFAGGVPEVMNFTSLVDFNYNAGILSEVPVNNYSNEYIVAGPKIDQIAPVPHARLGKENILGGTTHVGVPYITFSKNDGEFKLKWRYYEGYKYL